MSKIDWTKPIEWFHELRLVEPPQPSVVIGRDGDNYVVKRGASYHAYTPEGWVVGGCPGKVRIRNVPPPKIEKTVKLVLWSDGSHGLRDVSWNFNLHQSVMKPPIAVKTITITEGEGL